MRLTKCGLRRGSRSLGSSGDCNEGAAGLEGEIRRKLIVRDLTEPHWIRMSGAIVFGAAVLARSREGCRRARGSQNADMAKKDKLRTGPRSFLNAGTGAALSVSAIYAVI